MPVWMVLAVTLPIILVLGALYALQWSTNNSLKYDLELWRDEVAYVSEASPCFCDCPDCQDCWEKLPY